MQVLIRNATNRLRVKKYVDTKTGQPVTNATVTGTLFKQDGTPVTNAVDIAMPYNAAGTEPAEYEGILPATVQLPDSSYDLRAVGTNPDGVRPFNDTCIVQDG